MANTLLTIAMITREAIRLWKNSNAFIMNIDRQYDSSYAVDGAKIGTQLKIRLPNDYTVRTGPAASIQDTAEQSVTLTVATQKGIDVSFSSADRALSLDDYAERVLAPMINNLAGAVAADIMSGATAISNYVSLVDGSNNTISPTAQTWLLAGAALDNNSAPRGRRKIILDPLTQARTVDTLKGLFNPTGELSKQYDSGEMYNALGFDWMMDQTILKPTAGTFSAGGTVNGANQSGLTITVNATTGTLVVGDIVTFAGVNAVNRITKQTTGALRQFVITVAAASGATSLSIYPALIPPSGGNPVQYQTVTASPANGAVLAIVQKAGETARKNIVFRPEAVTMVTADLPLPGGVQEVARESFDSLSMRMVTDYIFSTDQTATRLDIIYGYQWVRPEWACSVMDVL